MDPNYYCLIHTTEHIIVIGMPDVLKEIVGEESLNWKTCYTICFLDI